MKMLLRSMRMLSASSLALLAAVAFLAAPASAGPAVLDYDRALGADFFDTYPQVPDGGNPFANGVPVSFGDWELRDSTTGSSATLITTGGAPFSGQNGWCVDDAGSCLQPPNGDPISYFGSPFQPGVTYPFGISDGLMGGHGPQEIAWTAPASVDAGGVNLSGAIEQLFEPDRVIDLTVEKVGTGEVFAVTASPPTVPGVTLNRVDFGPTFIAVSPGDQLIFRVQGVGNPSTFNAWDVRLTEAVPEPGTLVLAATCGLLGFGMRRRK